MAEILEIVNGDTVVSTEIITDLLESNSSEIIVEALPELIQEQVVSVDIIEVSTQGPPGPPGSGGSGGGFAEILATDYSDSLYAYVGTATKIFKLNYSTSPPIKTGCVTSNFALDWPNRFNLIYI